MPIRTVDITSIDTTGVKPGANLVYSHGNTSFEWVSGAFTPTATPAYSFQGSVAGYTSGGVRTPFPSYGAQTTIDKFPFSSDSNATDVGEITQVRQRTSGSSSSTHGYTAGGMTPSPTGYDTIDKFPFSSDTNATDVGELLDNLRAS